MHWQSEKNLLNSNISSTGPYNIVNIGPLTAEIGSLVWGTPANFNGCYVLALLMHQCHWTEVNQILHDVWPSPGLVHYIYIFAGSCPLTEFYQVPNSLSVQLLHSPILAALLHGTRVVGVSQTLQCWARGHHLYLAGRPSLGIGPHSSSHVLSVLLCTWVLVISLKQQNFRNGQQLRSWIHWLNSDRKCIHVCTFAVCLKVICNGFHRIDEKVVSSCLLQYILVCVINFDKLRRKMLKRRSLVIFLV